MILTKNVRLRRSHSTCSNKKAPDVLGAPLVLRRTHAVTDCALLAGAAGLYAMGRAEGNHGSRHLKGNRMGRAGYQDDASDGSKGRRCSAEYGRVQEGKHLISLSWPGRFGLGTTNTAET